MNIGLEEETFSKIILVILCALVFVVAIFIFDVMTGGHIIRTMVSLIMWYIPGTGRLLPGFTGVHGIPI
jgi:hypothetical protein